MPTRKREPLKNHRSIFVPLADVADLVWRVTRKLDSSNHFADMDEEGKDKFKGKTLLALCADPANVDPQVWIDFYQSLDVRPQYMGALPFRVWQIFDEMVASLGRGSVDRFVCAAGLLAHYVGDACQPLHVSHLHHGDGKDEKGVHAAYETRMLDRFTLDLVQHVAKARLEPLPIVHDGQAAAVATVELMRRTIKRLPPQKILDVYNAGGSDLAQSLWNALGPATSICVADGARVLAMIWKSAWKAGGGDEIPRSELGAVPRERLQKLYEDPKFLPAARLPELAMILRRNRRRTSSSDVVENETSPPRLTFKVPIIRAAKKIARGTTRPPRPLLTS